MQSLNALRIGMVVVVSWSLLPDVGQTRSFDEADDETERCLAEGKIVKKKKTLVGVTRPEMYLLDCDGDQRRVVVKQLDAQHRGVRRFSNGTWEMNFSDSYLYERAAYLLDRQLGLNMVPVAVIRQVKRNESAVIEWIDEASHIQKSKHQPTGPQVAELARQKAIMRLFDALIYNTDRNTSNFLVDDKDWRLYLIDHSRAFRQTSDLPETFEQKPARLSRDLYERLQALDEASLVELMDGLISEGQVRKMLERRDRILEKIDQDREEHGDSMIFSG